MKGSRAPERLRGDPTSRAVRSLRGTVGATIATLFAAASHTLAGGEALPLAILATAILALPLCVLLAGRIASLWRLTLAIGGAQFLYHWIFASLGSSAGASAPGAPEPLHAAHLAALQSFTPSAAPAAAHATMWIGHALGAAITIALIYRGERAFIALLQLIRRTAPLPAFALPQPVASPARISQPRTQASILRDRLFSTAAITHRGPPLTSL